MGPPACIAERLAQGITIGGVGHGEAALCVVRIVLPLCGRWREAPEGGLRWAGYFA